MVKTVDWNGNELHCIEWMVNGELEWCFLGKEVVGVLGYELGKNSYTKYTKRFCDEDEIIKVKSKDLIDKLNNSKMDLFEINRKGEELVTELGVYSLVLDSPLPEAKEFKKWVKNLIKSFREKSGLEQWNMWRMLDKEHQKTVNSIVMEVGDKEGKVNCIITNNAVNKIISCDLFKFNKPLKKGEMEQYEKMILVDREEVLQKYADNLVINDGSHTKAYDTTRKWLLYKYKHLLEQ